MKNRFFTPRMKMADLIAANHSLLLVLPRFGIHLGFGEQSVQEICDRYHLNVDFVLMIFNVYTFHDYLPDEDTFANTDLRPLVPYLLSSHRYYLNERLPHIERHLANVAAHAGERYGTILHQFFADYKSEVQDHFAFEEQQVFPILCQADEINKGYSWVIVFIYEDLQGEATIMNIADLVWSVITRIEMSLFLSAP